MADIVTHDRSGVRACAGRRQRRVAAARALGRHEVTRFGELFCCKRVARVAGSAAAAVRTRHRGLTPAHRGLEVKHWSGRLRLVGRDWVYERLRRDAALFRFADYNAEKLAALRRYLLHRARPAANRFEQRVVFTHPASNSMLRWRGSPARCIAELRGRCLGWSRRHLRPRICCGADRALCVG